MKEKAIEIERLTKYYGKSRGVDNLNLSVKAGEIFGFIGPNGAGKSTTIRILTGLIKCDSGSAKIFGKDVAKQKTQVLKEIGYLPSEAVFYSGMRVRDVIRLSADLRGIDCRKEADILCTRLELDTSKKVEELSLGNRKKAAVVCALQHKPSLCILDEPTGGMDPLIQKEFFSILKEHSAQGATIFLSSHILSEVQENCTQAAVIKDGAVAAVGSVSELAKVQTKRITIRGIQNLPQISGIHKVKWENDACSFLYGEDINNLIRALTTLDLKDLTIVEPGLEEVFLHYYITSAAAEQEEQHTAAK